MRAFCAWIAIVPVWQCLAEECSESIGSCAAKRASLMQFKSLSRQKQALALDAQGSMSEKLASFQKFTDQMVEKFGTAGSEAIDQETLDAVTLVLSFIEEMYDTLDQAHDDDVALLENCANVIDTCTKYYLNQTIVSKVNDYQVTDLVQTHAQCREKASLQCASLCSYNGPCHDYDTFRKHMGMYANDDPNKALLPTCVVSGGPGGDGAFTEPNIKAEEGSQQLEAMEECLEQTNDWLDGLYPRYLACTRIEENCSETMQSCDEAQVALERGQCLYATEVNGVCNNFRNCMRERQDTCADDCKNVEMRAGARAADNETGERLVCLLHILFGEPDPENEGKFLDRPDEADRPGKLEECKDKTIDTTRWEIPCPNIKKDVTYPTDIDCSLGVPVPEPCGEDWVAELLSHGKKFGEEAFLSETTFHDRCPEFAQRGQHRVIAACSEDCDLKHVMLASRRRSSSS